MGIQEKASGAVIVGGLGLLMWLNSSTQAQDRTKPRPGVVEATRFVLVDDDGATRAELSAEAAGAGLLFYDPKGHVTVQVLSPADGGAVVKLTDADGESRASLTLTPDGDAAVGVANGNSVHFVSAHAGDCGVVFRGKDGKVKGGMSLDARGRLQK